MTYNRKQAYDERNRDKRNAAYRERRMEPAVLGIEKDEKMTQITHQLLDGRYVQVVTPQKLRQILDSDGDDYARPSWFREEDEWNIEEGRS